MKTRSNAVAWTGDAPVSRQTSLLRAGMLPAGKALHKRLYALLRVACRVLGLKRRKGLGLALLGAAGAGFVSCASVYAANGIHLNAAASGRCLSINDPDVRYASGGQALYLSENLKTDDSVAQCNANPPAQSSYVVFYRPPGVEGSGSTSLSLGDSLWVNGGYIKLGDAATGIRIGDAATSAAESGLAIGRGAISGAFGVALANQHAKASGAMAAIALGNTATAATDYSIAFGGATTANGTSAIAIGGSALAPGASSISLGRFAQANGIRTIAWGRSSIARFNDSVALGTGATTSSTSSVGLGAGSGTQNWIGPASADYRPVDAVDLNGTRYSFDSTALTGAVSVGNLIRTRQIVNVAPGVVASGSSDAVNGAQLFAAYDAIGIQGVSDRAQQAALQANEAALGDARTRQSATMSSIAQVLGGGAAVNAGGNITMPTEPAPGPAGGASAVSVLGSVANLDRRGVAVGNQLGEVFSLSLDAHGKADMVAGQLQGFAADETVMQRITGVEQNALKWDEASQTYRAQHAAEAARKIRNVAAAVADTDAINKSQLDQVLQLASEAQTVAGNAGQSATAVQEVADKVQRAAAATEAVAIKTQELAGAAQVSAEAAQQTAGEAQARLAGLSEGETVLERIGTAVKAVATAASETAGRALTDALGVASDAQGRPVLAALAVRPVNADGSVGAAPGAATSVGDALSALDGNVLKVNDRLTVQELALAGLTQDLTNMRDDSLSWDKQAGSYSAARAGAVNNRIVNVASGQAETDAINKGQLDAVSRNVAATQTVADAAGQLAAGVAVAATQVEQDAAVAEQTAAAATRAAAEADDAARSAGQTAQAARSDVVVAQATAALAQETAAQARQVAGSAQSSAEDVRQAAALADASASQAGRDADAARSRASEAVRQAETASNAAQAVRDLEAANGARLAGIAEGQTVLGSIDETLRAAMASASATASGSQADALGGAGASMPGRPAYVVAGINTDGSVKPQASALTDVGLAVTALDANVSAVNDRVVGLESNAAQLADGVAGLRDDTLMWDARLQAFSADHGADGNSRIVNLAEGTAATDAINKGQLDTAMAQLNADRDGLLRERDGQLQLGELAAAQSVNVTGSISQRDSSGNVILDADGNALVAPGNRVVTGVAAGASTNDAVNRGQLDALADTTRKAGAAAADAAQAASDAQANAEQARQQAGAAQAAANGAGQSAALANVAAQRANQAAQALDRKLGGLAEGETVADRIERAADEAAESVSQRSSQAMAEAFSTGGKTMPLDYSVSRIDGDGAVQAGRAANVGDALAVLDGNVVGLGERLSIQAQQHEQLRQDLQGLQGDGLRWSEDEAAYSAQHAGRAPNHIVNVAAGQAARDAVNIGQLQQLAQRTAQTQQAVDEAALQLVAAQTTTASAQEHADVAQHAAVAAQGSADAAAAKLAGSDSAGTVVDQISAALAGVNGSLVDVLGGAATVGSDGKVSAPNYLVQVMGPDGAVQATPSASVGQALALIDGNVAAVNAQAADTGAQVSVLRGQLASGEIGLVQQHAASRDIAVATEQDGLRVRLDGAAGVRTLDGVKAGEISAASTEVITGSQLFTVGRDVMVNTQALGDLQTLTGRQVEALTTLVARVDSGNVGLVQQEASSPAVVLAADRGGKTLSVSGADGARQLSGVQDGKIAAGSTALVSGSQMNTVGGRVDRLATQTATVAVDSAGAAAVVAPGARAVAAGSNAQSTGSKALATGPDAVAVAANSSAMGAQAQAQGVNSTALGADAQASAADSVALGAGAEATRSNTVSVGTPGAERQIVNVAAATSDTDAVNLRQALHTSRQAGSQAAQQARRHTDGRVAQLRRENDAGVASAMAMAALPSTSTPGKSMVALSAATFADQTAAAVGVSARSPSGSWVYRFSLSGSTGGHTGASVGLTFAW